MILSIILYQCPVDWQARVDGLWRRGDGRLYISHPSWLPSLPTVLGPPRLLQGSAAVLLQWEVEGICQCEFSPREWDYLHFLVTFLKVVWHICKLSMGRLHKTLKALFNNVFTLKIPSCMSLHAISVFDKVYKWSPEKITPQKQH